MKKLLLLLPIMLTFSINICFAQDSNFKNPIVHGSKQSYSVTKTDSHIKTIRNLNSHLYRSKASHVVSKNDHSLEIIPKAADVHLDKAILSRIFYNTFSEKRLKQLANENLSILIHFYTDVKGNVLELGFTFDDSSTIMPMEIETLENQLQKEIKFDFKTNVFQDNLYVPLYYSVNFKMLVDHAPGAIYP
jgi:hypothetical protein